jgi:hypothetical protein
MKDVKPDNGLGINMRIGELRKALELKRTELSVGITMSQTCRQYREQQKKGEWPDNFATFNDLRRL